MNSRLQALIDRGYSQDDVMRLSSVTEEELEYASKKAFEHITKGCQKVEKPKTIYIGGQPGCGKTVLSMELKNTLGNYAEIGIDNYRMYHPHYLEIEKCIRKHWDGKKETQNDSPGNDIADFTHLFAGAVTDRLISLCTEADKTKKAYNILMEWGMREPKGPLETMKELKEKGYDNIVLFIATPSNLSYHACTVRANVMKHSKRIIRKVPKNFHDLCISTLPASIDKIYEEGYYSNIIDYMAIISRKGNVLWDCHHKGKPGDVYEEQLSKNKTQGTNDELKAITNNMKEMVGILHQKEQLNQIKDIVLLYNQNLLTNPNVKNKSA